MSNLWRVLLATVSMTILGFWPGTVAGSLEGSILVDPDTAGCGMDPNG